MASVKPNTSKSRPGGGHAADISGTALNQYETFDTFSCDVPITNPKTPDLITQQTLPAGMKLVEFERKFFSSNLLMPDGTKVEIWAFEDPRQKDAAKRFQFPSAPIIVHQGDLVHTILRASKNSHTIHHHGIEPTPMNDGVGHTSFEVTGSYTYQWLATEIGTFFYHCHKNTALHHEMGMYGMLIVLPKESEHVRTDGLFKFNAFPLMSEDVAIGTDVLTRTSFQTKDQLRAYDEVANWVADEMDPVWHKFHHNAGLCGEDAGLNNFNPKHFLISGVPFYQQAGVNQYKPFAPNPANLEIVTTTAMLGQTVLIRFINGGYTVCSIDLPNGDLEVVAIEDSGRQYGSDISPYSTPFLANNPGDLGVTPAPVPSARRASALVRAKVAGTYEFKFRYLHWITRKELGVAIATITFT